MEPERSSPASAGPIPKGALNSMLRDVVLHLLETGPHANFFRNAVSCVVVDDYREYVAADKEMYFSKILARTQAEEYVDVASFRADLQLMYENAAAYNGRNGGKHAYEPVIHWAAGMLAAADEELRQRVQTLSDGTQEHLQASPPHHAQPEAAAIEVVEAACIAAPAEPVVATSEGELPAEGSQGLANGSSVEECDGSQQQPLVVQQLMVQQPLPVVLKEDLHPETQDKGQIRDQDQQLSPVKPDKQKHPLPGAHLPVTAAVQSLSHPINAVTGQQPSSPSSGSGDGSRAGLEALLAACELAAEQDSAPRGHGGGTAAAAAAVAPAPERRSYPGCGQAAQQAHQDRSQGGDATQDGGSLWLSRQQRQDEDPAGSSEGGGMAVCAGGSGGGGSGGGGSGATGMELVISSGQAGGGGNAGAGGSYLASNAFKNRRHKSKVYIKPNKVVYLPTTFVEEEFDVASLPMDCELRVEADGVLTDETFRVTIKAVPRQGLSTMYCMTNVMRFQQQYLNWQIYNWTRVDNKHIKIHLQAPSPSQTHLQRNELDRALSLPEQVGRNCTRASEDGTMGFGAAWGQGPRGQVAPSSSLKRKSDTGRYNATRVERRLAPEPCRDLSAELRMSGTNYLQYPSPIPESPPDSPQRRISACLPPRAPSHGLPASSYRPSQIHIHHQGSHYQGPQQVFQQHGGLAPPFPLPSQQPQRGSNSSIATKQETCSEDSSGPVAVAEAALPLPLAWNPAVGAAHPARLQRPGGVSGVRSGASTPLFAGAGLQTVDVAQQIHELAERLQLQAQAQGAELNNLVALQLAMATLQQQQQQQQQQLMSHSLYNGGDGVAALDLSSAVDQDLVLQQLVLSAGVLPLSQQQQHMHHRGHRASGGVSYQELRPVPIRRASADGAADMGREPGMGMASALTHGGGFAQQGPCHPGTGAGELFSQQANGGHPGEQQRRSSHGDRSRSTQQVDRVMADAGGPSGSHELEQRSAGAAVESHEGDDVHHIVCHPRRSGSGNGPIGGSGRIFSVAPGGGRILVEVGGGAGGAAGPRISGTGSGTVGRRTSVGVAQQPGIGMAGMPSGLDLNDCALSYLSPSKRFKIAVSTDNAAAATAAAVAAAAVGGGELSVLDVLNLKAAAGALSMPPEAAFAAALRQGAGVNSAAGFQQAAGLGGRPFLALSPEMVGQLMS